MPGAKVISHGVVWHRWFHTNYWHSLAEVLPNIQERLCSNFGDCGYSSRNLSRALLVFNDNGKSSLLGACCLLTTPVAIPGDK